MLFSSVTFIYYFLPLVLLVYYVVPKQLKNLVLFLASLLFYAWGEPKYVFLMLLSVGIGYLSGMLMEILPKRPVMIVSVAMCLLFLIYFKYTNFFIDNINALSKANIPALNVIMPIGISFYTFQIISYILDVYYGRVKKQKNVLYLATYISMFPQLIAGPIVRYTDINEQLGQRKLSGKIIADGIGRFIIGLSKKVLVANQLGELCQIFVNSTDKSVAFYWLYAVAAALHIYFDFSGYSDMAIGLGKLLGFTFMENFNYPFMSKSITEFWRRWHMSLGTWFRDYVYIPLGGNRCGAKRQIFNILLVWFLTGFWHGAQWNFILWGVYFAVLLVVEKLWLYKKLNQSKVLGRIYALFLITISFVIFNVTTLSEIADYLKNMFFLGGSEIVNAEYVYYLKSYSVILLIAFICATNFPKKLYEICKRIRITSLCLVVVEPLVLVALLLICTAYLIDGSFNPFLYFRF